MNDWLSAQIYLHEYAQRDSSVIKYPPKKCTFKKEWYLPQKSGMCVHHTESEKER